MNEIWKDIKGYDGYQISNTGKVKSLAKQRITSIAVKWYREKLLYIGIGTHGYKCINIRMGGLQSPLLIHRLIAMAFIPNPENKPQVNHINGVKTDNRIENLEWCTCIENARHAVRTGLFCINQDHLKTIQDKGKKIVLNLLTGIFYDSAKEACSVTNYSLSTFYSWLNGFRENKTSFIYV